MLALNRVLAAFVGGTLAALLCAAALLRWLNAEIGDAMTASGMLLMLVWPALVVAAFVPERDRTSWLLVAAVAVIAAIAGWAAP